MIFLIAQLYLCDCAPFRPYIRRVYLLSIILSKITHVIIGNKKINDMYTSVFKLNILY